MSSDLRQRGVLGRVEKGGRGVTDADLVLEVNWGVEVRDFGVDGCADDVSFAGVQEAAHFCSPLLGMSQVVLVLGLF